MDKRHHGRTLTGRRIYRFQCSECGLLKEFNSYEAAAEFRKAHGDCQKVGAYTS